MNARLLTIYIREKFTHERDVLEYAEDVSGLFEAEEIDFGGVKEPADSRLRDTLIVTPPLSFLNDMLQ